MKSRIIVAILIFVAGVLFAEVGHIPYDRHKRPRLSLGGAYDRAMQALGKATNEFHCISASLDTRLSLEGEWLLEFRATNGTPMWATVEFNGQAHLATVYHR